MSRCQHTQELQAFLAGTLSVAARCALEVHVDECLQCQQALADLADAPDTNCWREWHRPVAAPVSDTDFLHDLAQRLPRREPESRAAAEIVFPGPPTPLGPLGQLGPFHIVRELGRGGTGVVFQAYDAESECQVALKILRPEFAVLNYSQIRLAREAACATSVSHDHIVKVRRVGSASEFSLPYLVLDYVGGESLRARLQREGILPSADAARIAQEVASALAAAHAHGLIHRDIKPSNILLDENGRAKLTDFGLARATDQTNELTRSGSLLGTPAYMSPEQVIAPQRVDATCDLYSLGVVLYEMVCGETPFRGSTPWILHQIKEIEPRSPRELNPRVPYSFETICLKCLAKESVRRYARADELATDLERFLSDRPIHARRPSRRERFGRWCRRNPSLAALAAVVACFVVIVTLGGWWSYYREQQRAEAIDKSRLEAVDARDLADKSREEAIVARDLSEATRQQEGMVAATRLLRQHRFEEVRGALGRVPASREGWEHRRLLFETRLTPHPDRVLLTHEFGILSLLADEVLKIAVSSGQDGRVLVCDTQTLAVRELEHGVWSREKRLWCHALCSQDEDVSGIDCYLQLCWIQKGVLLAGASYRGRGVVWDLRDGRRSEVLVHDAPLTAVAASNDGATLLFGDARGTVIEVERQTKRTRRLSLEASPVVATAALPPGRWLVAQHCGLLALVESTSETILHRLDTGGRLWAMDLSPDGKEAVTAGATLALFRVGARGIERSDEVYLLPEHETHEARSFHCVRFAPDARQLAAADDLGRLMVWPRRQRLPSFVRPDQDAIRRVASPLPALPAFLRRCSGLVFGSDGASVLTAGSDTAVKHWSLAFDDAITRFEVGSAPHVRFDPQRPGLLWVGDANGAVSVWNSRTATLFKRLHGAHAGAVSGIDAFATGLVVTAGADRRLRFWVLEGDEIRECPGEIVLDEAARSVAFSPDGKRLAVYDRQDGVSLWEVGTGRGLGQASLRDPETSAAIGGVAAFNCDGSVLAVVGPGQSSLLFDGHSLSSPPRHIYLAAGNGGTSLAWHPFDAGRLVGGDTMGRICAHPPQSRSFYTGSPEPLGITCLTFAPDGRRLVALRSDGTVIVYDPHLIGQVLRFQSAHKDATCVQFNPTGERIAVVHSDGHVAIWETQSGLELPVAIRLRKWQGKTLVQGNAASGLWLREQSAILAEKGRLCALYSCRKANSRGAAVEQTQVVLGQETDQGLQETVLDCFSTTADRGGANRSLAVLMDGTRWWAAWRRPRPDLAATSGAIVLAHGRDRRILHEELVTEPSNWGFDINLVTGANDRPALLHFSHSIHSWHATVHEGNNSWTTRMIGRQGDGYATLVSAPDVTGSCHVMFRPLRFGNDPSRDSHVRFNARTLCVEQREVITASPKSETVGIARTPEGATVVCYTHRGFRGDEVIVARRGAHGWECLHRFPYCGETLSNLTCDRGGAVCFAYRNSQAGIVLVSGNGTDWRHELVSEKPSADIVSSTRLVLLTDPVSGPVIVEWGASPESGLLRVWRPMITPQ